ncbi:LuxR C-terminal-related transcriptional regulator [Agromyces sp. NPDC056379]|uniref:LuxR C-terminal-related transcriptional regulator n=1 Tax=unclassified Agromyces TaxID=2639701 RepID=UPI0035E253FF
MESVLSGVVTSLRAIAEGAGPAQALCAALIETLHAEAGATGRLDSGTDAATMPVLSMSDPRPPTGNRSSQLQRVLPQLLYEALGTGRPSCLSRSGAANGSVGNGDVLCMPLSQEAEFCRFTLVRRDRTFTTSDLHLAGSLQQPLALLYSISASSGGQCDPPPEIDPQLTTREVEVLRLVADGLLARTIALQLEISPRTVHKHLGSAYRKLNAHDRLIAVRRAASLGLLQPL